MLTLTSALLSVVVAVPSAQAQNYKVLYAFQCGSNGLGPVGPLARDNAGNLFGASGGGDFGGGTVFELSASGTITVLHSFPGAPNDGIFPNGVVRDAAGNLYGTTNTGGANNFGTVFEVSAAGAETVLYSFGKGPDGEYPQAGLLRDATGNLYGITYSGGATGSGTVFKVTPAGVETVLYNFGSGTGDGANPTGGLVHDNAGNLYGTTALGGSFGQGTVFELAENRKETILHSFDGSDGTSPLGGVILDKASNLYGTTLSGGDDDGGVVFKLDPAGTESVLYNFDLSPLTGGYNPRSGLVGDAKGNVYGTTELGGISPCNSGNGCGVVFRVSPTGQETVFHKFSGSPTDGQDPSSGLISDSAGNLYGTTPIGGANGCGIVYKLGP